MITLIIFLSLIMLGALIIKPPIIFKLKIANENLDFYYKAFFKERHIKNKVNNFVKSGSAEFDKNVLLEVSEVIDIEEFKTNVVIGTPIIDLTNTGVLFFSYLIPTIYRLPFRKKEGLCFKVLPKYTNWEIQLSVEGKIHVSLINTFIIIYKIKKRLKRKRQANV